MSKLQLMVTITNRDVSKKFQHFYKEKGLDVSLMTLGKGTASNEVLDYFGLDGSEKSIFLHVISDDMWLDIKRDLQRVMNIDVPGVGIAFTIPLSSIGGKKALNYLTDGRSFVKEEESELKETKYELLIVIANQGYSELIMDAAREVHAAGGTVIHAKGTGIQKAEKFLGVSLVAEKELVLIVVKTEMKNNIMRAIMDKAGLETDAKSIVFSLPVTGTAGMRMMEEILEP
ncbi:MAG: P-II family nitrogen regulator [Firmicutes bacterium]|nr:P-II family nitrogen regulator [Bacillota bacterium]